MHGASTTSQNESKDDPFVGAHDGGVSTTHLHTSHRPNPSPLRSYSTHHPSWSSIPLTLDGVVETNGPGIRQGVDRIYSTQPLDTFTQPGPFSFRDGYPLDVGYTQHHFEYNGMRIDLMEQDHLNSMFMSNYLGQAGAPYLTPMAPATAEDPVQEEIEILSSAQSQPGLSIPSQGSPLPRLESTAQVSLLGATLALVNVDGTSEYCLGPTPESHTYPGHYGPTLFSAPLPFPDSAAIGQESGHSQGYIALHHEYGSQDRFFPDSSSAYGGERFASPDPMDIRRQDDPSSVSALADGHHHRPPHRPATLENGVGSFVRQTPSRRYTEPMPGSVHDYVSQPYTNSGHHDGAETSSYANSDGMILDEICYPQPIPQGQFCDNIAHDGRAPSAAMYTTADSSTMMSFFTSGNENYDPSQQRATGDYNVQPSTSPIPNWMDIEPPCVQSLDQWFPPLTSTDCQSSSFAGHGSNVTQAPLFSSPNGLSDQPPSTPRRETVGSSADLVDGFPCCSDTTDDDDFADEEQEFSSPAPSTHPWTGLNAEERRKRALKASPRRINAALLHLLLLIVELPCVLAHELEPTISSSEGRALISQIRDLPGCPPLPLDTSVDSIFSVFVAYPKFRCLICGKKKQSMVRGVGCVRKHLEHRPYPCYGDGGCKSCPKNGIAKGFCSASSLDDHRKKQGRSTKCPSCGTQVRGNLGRHKRSRKCKGHILETHRTIQKDA